MNKNDYVRFVGADVETTDLKVEDGHRITELAIVVYDYVIDEDEFHHRKTFSTLVNPERSISAKASELTGITAAMVAKERPFRDIAPAVANVFNSANCFVAHNLVFDAGFLAAELSMASQKFNMDSEPFCTMQNGRFASPLGEVPKLARLCWSLGVEFDDTSAHRADYDTEKMMLAFIKGCRAGWFKPECLKGMTWDD